MWDLSMSSWDITFCTNPECKKTDCRRHYTKALEAFDRGAVQLSFFLATMYDGDEIYSVCDDEENCKHYWKE